MIASIVGSALLARLILYANPGAGGSTVLGFHVHHLLVGIILVCLGGIPAILLRSGALLKSVAVCTFGIGVGLALDEWVLFVARENVPDTPYGSTISLAGALASIVLVCVYALLVYRLVVRQEGRRMVNNTSSEGVREPENS